MSVLPFFVAAWLLLVGIYGIVTSRNLIHLIVCLSVVQSSTYVLLLAIGYKAHAAAPVFLNVPLSTPAVDPVVQALVLTDIVVGATVTALLLGLVVQTHKRSGTLDPEALHSLRG
jgi:multicomponent Na+:H+ antiporter subunit C